MRDQERSGAAAARSDGAAAPGGEGSASDLAAADQARLRPTERRFGEALPTDGQNGQNSTPARVARPTDPGATPGIPTEAAPPGAGEVADRGRGAPRFGPEDADTE